LYDFPSLYIAYTVFTCFKRCTSNLIKFNCCCLFFVV